MPEDLVAWLGVRVIACWWIALIWLARGLCALHLFEAAVVMSRVTGLYDLLERVADHRSHVQR